MRPRRPRNILEVIALIAPCLAALSTSGSAHALDPVPEDVRDANSGVGVMVAARRFSYAELNHGLTPALPGVLDSENGWLPAFRAEARLERDLGGLRNAYVRATFEHASGDLTYDGRTQPTSLGGSMPVQRTTGAALLDAGVEAGVGIALGRSWAVTPLARYQYRQWTRGPVQGQSQTFDEYYQHHELAAGGLAQVVLAKGLVAGAAATFGATVAPGVAFRPTRYAELLRLALGNALVARGELSVGYAISTRPRFQVVVAYELGTFAYGRSSTVPSGMFAVTEPDSRTFEHELRAGLTIGF